MSPEKRSRRPFSPPKEKLFSAKRKRSSVSQKKSPSPQRTPSPKPPSTVPPTPPLSPTVSEPAVNVVPPDPPVPTNLSALARKYGIVHVDTSDEMYMKYLYNRGKSDPVFIVNSSSKPEEEFHYREIEHYQKIIFNGFTANELLEVGAYPVLGQEEIPIEDPIQ
ncbi:hypothetical protein HYALB_00004858 [Hymenoscyphus albidus]|uniref:Uncharacterized protein n=1 Tax=Hymenoscyphus albidus TaxID=595503 RepID=A0A9N9QC50_9HELO|nr:hypothetical protein HYALB_00004858 [Hymenoscyphus albidus]